MIKIIQKLSENVKTTNINFWLNSPGLTTITLLEDRYHWKICSITELFLKLIYILS